MSIYNPGFDFNFSAEKLKKPAIAVIAAIALFAVIVVALSMPNPFSAKPVTAWFEENPISTDGETTLFVRVSNPGNKPITASVEARAIDSGSLYVGPPEAGIGLLDRTRELKFIVNTVGKILPGDYVLVITFNAGDEKYTEQVKLSVREG